MPFIVYEFMLLLLWITCVVLVVLVMAVYLTTSVDITTTVSVAVIGAIWIMLMFYIWLCVVSHYQILVELHKYLVVRHHAQPDVEHQHDPDGSNDSNTDCSSDVHTGGEIDGHHQHHQHHAGDPQQQQHELVHNEGHDQLGLIIGYSSKSNDANEKQYNVDDNFCNDYILLNILLILDNFTPPCIIVATLSTLHRHLKCILHLSICATINFQGT